MNETLYLMTVGSDEWQESRDFSIGARTERDHVAGLPRGGLQVGEGQLGKAGAVIAHLERRMSLERFEPVVAKILRDEPVRAGSQVRVGAAEGKVRN